MRIVNPIVRGTSFVRRDTPPGWMEIDSTRIDRPGKIDRIVNPYINTQEMSDCEIERRNDAFYGAQYNEQGEQIVALKPPKLQRGSSVIRLPAFEKVCNDTALYAHATKKHSIQNHKYCGIIEQLLCRTHHKHRSWREGKNNNNYEDVQDVRY